MHLTPSPLPEGFTDLGLVTGTGTAMSIKEATSQAISALRVDAAVKRVPAVYGVRFDLSSVLTPEGVLTAVLATGTGCDRLPAAA